MEINEKIEAEPYLFMVEPSLVSVTTEAATFSNEPNGKSVSNGKTAVSPPHVTAPPPAASEEKRLQYQAAKITVLCIVVVVVWMLLYLPVIFYHLPDQDEGTSASEVPNQLEEMGGIGPTVTCDIYTGDVCRNMLQSQQDCLPDRLESSDIYISPRDGVDQDELEIQAGLLLNGLSSASPECVEAVLPFLCLYLFRLCDSNGTLYQPSSGDCVTISTVVCEREWIAATTILGPERLPQCELLPAETFECEIVASGGNVTDVECHDGFYVNNNFCRPQCDTWEQHPHTTTVVADVFVLLSAAIGVISGVAVLVISFIRRKRMFVFPSVIIIYMTITLVVLGLTVLISYMDRSGLFCSSLDLLQSVANTSDFCTFAGTVFYYTLLQLALWWFFHVAAIFWKIRFPFSARAAESTLYIKLVHVTVVVLAVVVPIVPVVTTLKTSGFGLTRFPPILCTGTNADATFYSLVLPIVVLLQVGISLLIVIFWKIHKQHGLFRIKRSKGLDTAERKILIIFCYYVILGVIALTTFTLSTKNSESVANGIVGYFGCESSGPQTPCDRSGFEPQLNPVLDCLSYILLGLFPAVNLVFAVNVKELKQWCGRSRLFRVVSTTAEFPSTVSASAPTVSSSGNDAYALPPA